MPRQRLIITALSGHRGPRPRDLVPNLDHIMAMKAAGGATVEI
jgi:hypothetical protein